MALSGIIPKTHLWVKREDTDRKDNSGSIIQFRLRSNSKNQEISSSVPVEINGKEFMLDDFKSFVAILKLVLSSSVEIDYRIREWIIPDIVEKTREILPVGVTLSCGNKTWLVDVEIENNGIGFPCHKICSNCFGVLPPGWTDTCETCLLFM